MKERDICCECGADIGDKPADVVVCDSCKAKRAAHLHALLMDASILKFPVKKKQGGGKAVARKQKNTRFA